MPWLPMKKEVGGKQPAELVPDSDVELDAAGRALLGERESPTRPLPCCVRARIVSLNGGEAAPESIGRPGERQLHVDQHC